MVLFFLLGACSKPKNDHPGNTGTGPAVEIPDKVTIESGKIYYVDMESKDLYDLFAIESLQGNVNRKEPLIWVLKTPVVEYDGPGRMVDRSFWLNTIQDRSKVAFNDPLAMIRDFSDKISGCVIYNDDLFGSYRSGARYPQPDENTVAKLNATAMLCAKYNAVALTQRQYDKLKTDYKLTLPILGNTTTADFSNWVACYKYIYNNFKNDFSTTSLANNPHFCLGMMDLLIKNKMFIINMKGSPTVLEQNITEDIFAACPSPAPVFGVWNVSGGTPNEDSFQHYLNERGKYSIVNFEAFNLSFTSGLPKFVPSKSETKRPLQLDRSKKYICFTETDGDNYEFIQQIFPLKFGVTGRENAPIGWEIPSTLCELDPVAAKWFFSNIGQNTFVNPVTGAGYYKYNLPKEFQSTYFDRTNTYMADSKFSSIRTMFYNLEDGRPLTAIPSVAGVFCGYGGNDKSRPTLDQYPVSNELYNGKPIFLNYSYLDIQQITAYQAQTPAFFSVACVYTDPADILKTINTLPADWVVVSPGEMIDLYQQFKQ